jgi:hypothetical protein
MTKYNSKKVIIDEIQFDSKVEGDYYLYLKEQLRCGKIAKFDIQPKVELIPKFEKLGVKHRAITYTPDFLIYHLDNSKEYIDIKGFGTLASDLRRKLFDYLYREDKLTWLSYVKKYGGWVEYDLLTKLRRENKKEK